MMGRASPPLAALGLWAACLLAGCNGGPSPRAVQLMTEARQAMQLGQAQRAAERMDTLLAEEPAGKLTAEAYCLRGRARYRLGQPQAARADLERAVAKARQPAARQEGLMALGELTADLDDLPAAERAYRQALEIMPPAVPPADQALYQLGLVLQREDRWTEADLQFDRLVYLFPQSDWTRQAGPKVRCRAWTIQAGEFADRPAAEAAARGLRQRNLPAETFETLQAGRLIFRVQVGRYPTRRQAAAALDGLRPPLAQAAIIQTR